MTTDRPLVFLDIDGVLNRFAMPPAGQRETSFHVEVPTDGWSFDLLLDRRDTKRIGRLAEHADMAWGTTWEDDAPKVADLLGIDSRAWPIARRDRSEYFKAEGIIRVAGKRPFVWLDDEIARHDRTVFDESGCTWLGIDVDPNAGLRDAHVERAIEWACRHRV